MLELWQLLISDKLLVSSILIVCPVSIFPGCYQVRNTFSKQQSLRNLFVNRR